MFVLVFLLLMNIRNIDADDNNRSIIDVAVTTLKNGSFFCNTDYPSKMTYYEPFQVRIKTDQLNNDVELLEPPICVFKNETTFIQSFRRENKHYVSTNVLRIAEGNVDEFRCDLRVGKKLAGETNKTARCAIHLYPIRDPFYCTGYMTVNGQTVNFTTSPKDMYSDKSATFDFYDGQYANFACSIEEKPNNAANLIQMTYSDKDNKRAINTDYLGLLHRSMFVKLTKDYNNGYFDCKFADYEGKRFTIVRMSLKMTEMPENYFLVNGVTLGTINTDKKRTVVYEYYENENIHITFKSSHEIKSISCLGDHFPKVSSTSEKVFATDVTPQNKIIMDLHCDVGYKTRGITMKSFLLRLTPQELTNTSTISGLSMLNILAKYAVPTIMAQNKTTIFYQYRNELNLTSSCYNDSESIVVEYNTTSDNTTSSFKLIKDAKTGKIKCDELGTFTEIFLSWEGNTGQIINKPTTSPDDKPSKNQPHTTPSFDDNGVKTISTPTNTLPDESFFTKFLYEIISGVLLFTVVVLTCSIVKCIKRNTRKDLDDTKVIYNNMEGSGSDNGKPSGQTPTRPAREEELYAIPINSIDDSHYAQPYVAKNVEELYTQAIPKNQRQISQEEPSYAAVGESNYAEVLPKSVRQGIAVLPMGGTKQLKKTDRSLNINKDTPYHNISATKSNKTVEGKPKTIDELFKLPCTSNGNNCDSIAQENPYAEVGCNTPTNKYANVFDNQRYVNANKTDDYAEPAYCELSGYNK